jgi:hypothetical protein
MASGLLDSASALLASGDLHHVSTISAHLDDLLRTPLSKQDLGMLALLYLKLLDRLFGEDVTSPPEIAVEASTTSTWVKGPTGGWLKLLSQSASTHPSQTSSNAFPNLDQLSHPGCRILKHLLPNSPLFQVLGDNTFDLSVSLLPPLLQMNIKQHPLFHVLSNPLHYHLLQIFSCSGLSISNSTGGGSLRLEAKDYLIVCLLRYPLLTHYLGATTITTTSTTKINTPSQVLRQHNNNPLQWIRTSPYFVLLASYLDLQAYFSPTGTIANIDRSQEVALRLAGEYWLCSGYVLHRDFHKAADYRRMLRGEVASYGAAGLYSSEEVHPHPTEVRTLEGCLSVSLATLQVR